MPLALAGALFINLLIMALIPWLFRGGGGHQKLPRLIKEPLFLEQTELDQEQSQASQEPEPRPELELPEPPPEIMKPLPPIPELNPEIELSKVMLEAQIETDFKLQPLPETPITPVPTLSRPDFYRIGEVDREPLSTTRMEPVYPFLARRRGVEGSVNIRFFVTRQGRVEGVKIIKAVPPGYFEKAVHETVANWRFQPGMVNGAQVKTLVETTIVFKLGR
ncbi:MAG: energy transducer TonB [Deltaproteobacteria bacterium]|nr:energy transducer TonB [Candidatus Tharpella aukensis]